MQGLQWYDDRAELLAFIVWLYEEHKIDDKATAVLDVFEKPWHWNDEHAEYLTTLGAGNDGI
jgi:hypothetical protein